MKIYTGTGDRGKTGLFSGERLPKSDDRIEAYGDVDELNSVLGALAATLPEKAEAVGDELAAIQSHLFHVGAWLATTSDSSFAETLTPVDESMWRFLETAIDRMEGMLPPLSGFIIPGGHKAAAMAHVARTVCRRAERRAVRLAQGDPHPEALSGMLIYLNRLSDYLFVLARYFNQMTGHGDHLWEG